MPAVLTTASRLVCVHGGELVVRASTGALTAGGSPVLVLADLLAATVSATCSNTDVAKNQKPCTMVTSVLSGASTTLAVGGRAVALETARGLTDGLPTAPVMWRVDSAGQHVLEAT
ncbi:hypothetical protein ACFV9W_31440 [Streptomyces sp. NPDC059897]|uniref:hypothetical protein n=1 Tax=Streptomyces sp. NPDC059897 TaxID=3346994 RepID=UPI0036582819